MKKIIAFSALCIMSFALSAQDPKGPPPHPKKEMKDMSPENRAKLHSEHAEKKLGLNADQKAKWEAAELIRVKANNPHREKMKGSTTPEERKEIHKQVKVNNEAFEKTVNEFLTAEQKTKWEAEKKDRREKRMKKMGGKGKADEIDVNDLD